MPFFSLTLWIAVPFLALTPLMTYLLLVLKGLPSFATPHPVEVLAWVYLVNWIPSLIAGGLLSMLVAWILARTRFFHRPYDFGRCFSLGAVAGALLEGIATWLFRLFREGSHRTFTNFWIAGAILAGALAGSVVVSAALWVFSKPSIRT